MNQEIVSVLVHSPKRKRDLQKTVDETIPPNPPHGSQALPRTGKPSRRWLISELDKVKRKTSELTKQLTVRNEIERNLIESKSKLERDLALLKSQRAVGSHENEAIRERNKQLSQDIYLMKNILVKLNAELEWYQGKLRKYENDSSRDKGQLNDPITGNVRPGREKSWLDGELSVFAPLVTAFEESIYEKDQLIQDLKNTLQQLSGKLKEIIMENTELREKITECDKKGEVSLADWIAVQREMSLITEQNLLLKRQSALAQVKISQLKAAYQSKLGEISNDKEDLTGKLSSHREEYLVLKGKYSALEQEIQRAKEEATDRIPKSVHSAYIAECKRLLDELKSRHEEERASLLKKTCTHEPADFVTNEHQRIRELEATVTELKERYSKSERRREALKCRLNLIVTFSKELILEHENLLKAVGEEMGLSTGLASRLENIKKQLKGLEVETRDQIKLLDENIASQVERVNWHCNQQRNEIEQLRQQLIAHDIQPLDLKDTGEPLCDT